MKRTTLYNFSFATREARLGWQSGGEGGDLLLTGFMVVTMSGSPPTGLGSPGSSQAEFSGDYNYLGFARAGRVSPPLSKKEADQTLSWLSVARPTVDTKLDEYVEGEKQWSEKEVCCSLWHQHTHTLRRPLRRPSPLRLCFVFPAHS